MNEVLYREAEQRLWESLGVKPTQHRIHLDRNNVTVRLQEVGDGPAAIFIHGTSTGGSSWANLARRLTGLRCLLLDRPGTGLSDPLNAKVNAEGLRRFADTLIIDILDGLGLQSAHLVATSFGGAIALRSAAAHPARVGRMVQFSSPVGVIRPRWRSMLPLIPITILPPSERRARALFRRIGNGKSLETGGIGQEEIDWFVALLRHTDTRRNEWTTFRTSRGPTRLAVPDSTLAGIHTPTYFLWGDNDPFGSADVARQLAGRMPAAVLELRAGAGHAPWLHDVEYCSKAVSRFLAGD